MTDQKNLVEQAIEKASEIAENTGIGNADGQRDHKIIMKIAELILSYDTDGISFGEID